VNVCIDYTGLCYNYYLIFASFLNLPLFGITGSGSSPLFRSRIIVNSNRRTHRVWPTRLLITRSALISLSLYYVSSLTTGVVRLTA